MSEPVSDEAAVPPLPVVAAVIRREDRVLLTRRPMDKARPGLWEFPGGKVEPDESPTDALIREIQEELHCTIAVKLPLTTVIHSYPDLTISLTAYWAILLSGEPKLTEHIAIEWVRIADLATVDLCEADRAIAAACGAAIEVAPEHEATAIVWERGDELD